MSSLPSLPRRLYRGASDRKVERDGGLCPPTPGKPFTTVTKYGRKHPDGEPLKWDDGQVYGDSPKNELLLHQYKGMYGTSGVSTSPKRGVAERYAKGRDGRSSGVVYELDVEKLIDLGCEMRRVNDHVTNPTDADDDEYTVVAQDFGVIPEAAVVGSFRVSPEGDR